MLQRIGEFVDARRFPPPGQMVDVGGRKLHIVDHGGSGPTVVVETGSGALALGWDEIAAELTSFCRVITYDRAGYGWSDAPPNWRWTGENVASDLKALLDAADIAGPYVLVGHSLGGLYVRSFERAYPDDVAGLVLVDSSHEDMLGRIRATLGVVPIIGQAVAGVAMQAFPRGLVRVPVELGLLDRVAPRLVGGDSRREVRERLSRYLRSAFRRATLAEMFGMPETMRGLRNGDRRVAVPLAVVTAAEPEPGNRSTMARLRPVWKELQGDLASRSDDAEHIVATRGGHFVHNDDPDAVIGAIRGVVARVVASAR